METSSSSTRDALLRPRSNELSLRAVDVGNGTDDNFTVAEEEVLDWLGRPATSSHGGSKASFYILANQALWNVAVNAVSANLVLYLVQMLQMSNAAAANNVNNWAGTKFMLGLVGGFMADSQLGRFWTCAVCQFVTLLGMLLLSFFVTLPVLKPAECSTTVTLSSMADMHSLPLNCTKPSVLQMVVFMIAIYAIALGSGSAVPVFQALGGDQFKSNEQQTVFFSRLFLFTNAGSILASTLFVWIQNQGMWSLAHWVATALGALALFLFGLGTPIYRHFRPAGNPIARVAQVLVACACKWKLKVPSDEALLYELDEDELVRGGCRKMPHTNMFRFLDKACVKNLKMEEASATAKLADDQEVAKSVSRWKLCYVTQVEEVKQLCRIFPMILTGIPVGVIYTQANTFFIEQAAAMNTKLGSRFYIPPASMSMLNTLSILLLTPLYPLLLVPFARLITGRREGLSSLQRMIGGQIIAALSIAAAAFLEGKRLACATDNTSSINIIWQAPQQILMGASSVLYTVGSMEFLYVEAPHSMRGIMSSLIYVTAAIGGYFSSAIVSIVVHATTVDGGAGWIPSNLNQGHLDYFFWLVFFLSNLSIILSFFSIWWFYRTGSC